MKKHSSTLPVLGFEKVGVNGRVSFIILDKVSPKGGNIDIVKVKMVGILKRVITSLEEGENIDGSMEKECL